MKRDVILVLLRAGKSGLANVLAYSTAANDYMMGHRPAKTTAGFDDRIDELLRQQAQQRRKKIGIDGDRLVTDQIEVLQAVPGKVWSFVLTSSGMEIVRVNGLKRARQMREVLRDSGLRDFRKLRELAFEWRKANPR